MSGIFGDEYSLTYDLVYKEKDYAKEHETLLEIFQKYGEGAIDNVLDLGCGTGAHTLPLALGGKRVTGVDRSQKMLEIGRKKSAELKLEHEPEFVHGDLRTVDLNRQFDAALMMFAVLGYQTGNKDVLAALKNSHRHLRKGGLLFFDVWYGPAILFERPSQRVKVIPTYDGQLLRVADGKLDVANHLCAVNFQIWRMKGDRILGHIEEEHNVRYFFPLELKLFLEVSGFSLERIGAFPEFKQGADETTWNVSIIARRL